MQKRPDPNRLLKLAHAEETKKKHGKLKIYLGAAPGVGKTFTMLHDAYAKRTQGLDVVLGIVETHGRKEVELLLKDVDVLPRVMIDYHGRHIKEFDLDAALKRNPGLILVDEMAHTNTPGMRHAKRWQDINELLNRGIDVYTTLNVQHIESLNDIVSQIIHTRVKETVPDHMLELADSIELVDLPPEDLLKRLQEGKVYIPEQAQLAAEHFFRKGNLIALRELALRVTAERVGKQVLMYRQGLGIKHIWPTKDKILVCVGHREESAKLIRAASRMATKLHAEWIAVHVDTPWIKLTDEESKHAIENVRLAERLGAETRVINGFDIVKELLDFSREQNITMIMVWKHIRSRWRDLLFRSLADELARMSGEIDIYVVTSEFEDHKPFATYNPRSPSLKNTVPWTTYAIAVAVVAVCTLIDIVLFPVIGGRSSNLIMVYMLGIIGIALFGRMSPSLMTSILSIIAFDYFFVKPYYSLYIDDTQYIYTLILMLLVSQMISYLTIRTRKQIEIARVVQNDMAILHTLSRQLASTRGVDKLLRMAVHYLSDIFHCNVLALIPEDGHLTIRVWYGMDPVLSAKEQGVAQWVYDLGEIAGLGTDTLPFSEALYVPLLASQGVIGVLCIKPTITNQVFSAEQANLLTSCANQIALALEVDRLQEQSKIHK